MNIIMTHPKLPESHSSSRITRPYLTSLNYFTRNTPSSIQQNAYITSVFRETPVVAFCRSPNLRNWFAPRLKVPKVIHSAILLWYFPLQFETRLSHLPVTSMTVEPPTRSAPRVRHGRSNNTSLANQTILLI